MPEAYLSTSSIIDSSIIGVSWLVDPVKFDWKTNPHNEKDQQTHNTSANKISY